MTQDELKDKLKELEREHAEKQKAVIREYCDANNPYKVGDVFTDHLGSIVVEKIYFQYSYNKPCCVYHGTALKKDGSPRKNGEKRQAWQSNDINKTAP